MAVPMSAIESAWQLLIANFTEFQLATVITFLLHETVFFLSGLPSLLFERFGLFAKYKIQKRSNTSAYQNRCVLRLILYHVSVNLPVMILSYPAFKFMGLRSSLPLPHWVLETVEAHSGYHFPWSPSNFLPLYGGSDFHDYHHRVLYTKSGNYASTFVYMDWLFRTDNGYRKAKRPLRSKK
ncbi:Methylsterol monooxygenase 2-2 [Zea mays]|uniref:Methylsterol monooxygenase 2-2 n=1 Tax=Zea mays TaxID=4577 RepID=A0A1D6G3P7_MAIZE|nr:Methylsterol monooxygenase 2-2 [Zea mays]